MVFDRVLDSDNLDFWVVNSFEEGVESGSLAGACGPCGKDHAVGFSDFFVDNLQKLRVDAELVELDGDGIWVEYTQDY